MMKLFNQSSACPKCGSLEASTKYHEGRLWNSPKVCPSQEHIDRVCQRCVYLWAEAVLSEKKP